MVSYDVENLFTNIPLEESSELSVNYILNGNPKVKLTQDFLTKLFFYSDLSNAFFMIRWMEFQWALL